MKNKKKGVNEMINYEHFKNLNSLINNLLVIDFSFDKKKYKDKKIYKKHIKTEILKFNNSIDDVYLEMTKYILSGNFVFIDNKNITNLIDVISSKTDDFLTSSEPEEVKKIEQGLYAEVTKIEEHLIELKENFLIVLDLKKYYVDNKLYDIDDLRLSQFSISREENNKKIFAISYIILDLEYRLNNNIKNKKLLKNTLLRLLKELEEFKKDNSFIKILIEKIQFNLYKLGYKRIKVHYNHTVEDLDLIEDFAKKTTIYGEAISIYNLIDSNGYSTNRDLMKTIRSELGDETTLKDIYIKLYYYKDNKKDSKKLGELFNFYLKNFIDKSIDTKINAIYIGNTFLSCLIDDYYNLNDKELYLSKQKEIEELYKDINKISKEVHKVYQNFFTALKYAKYFYIRARKEGYIEEYKQSKTSYHKARENIKKSEDIYLNDTNFGYLFYPNKEQILQLGHKELPYLYHPFIYSYYQGNDYHQIISSLKSEIELGLSTFSLRRNVSKVQNEMSNNKTDSMQILGVFAGIVLFASGTIQIFTKIDDLGSALVFVSLYSASLLFLLAGINFADYSELKRNKSAIFSFLAVTLIIITSVLYYIVGNGVLNINSLNETRVKAVESQTELKKLIQEEKKINTELDEKIKQLDQRIKELNILKIEKNKEQN